MFKISSLKTTKYWEVKKKKLKTKINGEIYDVHRSKHTILFRYQFSPNKIAIPMQILHALLQRAFATAPSYMESHVHSLTLDGFVRCTTLQADRKWQCSFDLDFWNTPSFRLHLPCKHSSCVEVPRCEDQTSLCQEIMQRGL